MNDNRLVAKVRLAKSAPLAALLGAALGGFVPAGVCRLSHSGGSQSFAAVVAHYFAPFDPSHLLVLGGLLFSAKTVWQWGRETFQCAWKATGLVVFLEGSMSFVADDVLNYAALALLLLINLIDAAAVLASPQQTLSARLMESDGADDEKIAETSASQQILTAGRIHDGSLAMSVPCSSSAGASAVASASRELLPERLQTYERVMREVTAHEAYSAERLRKFVPCGSKRAAQLMQQLEAEGIVGPLKSSPCGGRKVIKRVSYLPRAAMLA
jgi:hypothetical protein